LSSPPPGASGERDEEASARAAGEAVAEVARVMARLRGEGGCPWDRAQTRETLRGFVLEEAYEVVEALDRGDAARIRDELGDLLFQVVFQARIGEERGEHDLAQVARGLRAKLVRRHPHVFGPEAERRRSPAEIERLWEELKRAEREAARKPHGAEAAEASPALPASPGGGGSALDGVPAALPALLRLERLQERAARAGVEWRDASEALARLDEERRELLEAAASGDRRAIAHELGDTIGALVGLGRLLGVSAEDAARAAADRFAARFRRLEALAGERRPDRDLRRLGREELEGLWEVARGAGPEGPPAP